MGRTIKLLHAVTSPEGKVVIGERKRRAPMNMLTLYCFSVRVRNRDYEKAFGAMERMCDATLVS